MKARTTSTPSSSAARRPGSRRSASAAACLLLALLCGSAAAQQGEAPNGVLLVAKPSVQDPNFRQTVVLVTQAPDASTVGVILNRPTTLKPSQLLPQTVPSENYRDAVFFGGPVMRTAVLALFRSPTAPVNAAFAVLPGIYLSMHHANVTELLASRTEGYRLYVGFAGWAPRQLENELKRDDWYVLPASENVLFRRDTAQLWSELFLQASGQRAALY